jgi:hypothetical protein
MDQVNGNPFFVEPSHTLIEKETGGVVFGISVVDVPSQDNEVHCLLDCELDEVAQRIARRITNHFFGCILIEALKGAIEVQIGGVNE